MEKQKAALLRHPTSHNEQTARSASRSNVRQHEGSLLLVDSTGHAQPTRDAIGHTLVRFPDLSKSARRAMRKHLAVGIEALTSRQLYAVTVINLETVAPAGNVRVLMLGVATTVAQASGRTQWLPRQAVLWLADAARAARAGAA